MRRIFRRSKLAVMRQPSIRPASTRSSLTVVFGVDAQRELLLLHCFPALCSPHLCGVCPCWMIPGREGSNTTTNLETLSVQNQLKRWIFAPITAAAVAAASRSSSLVAGSRAHAPADHARSQVKCSPHD